MNTNDIQHAIDCATNAALDRVEQSLRDERWQKTYDEINEERENAELSVIADLLNWAYDTGHPRFDELQADAEQRFGVFRATQPTKTIDVSDAPF